MWKNSRLKHKIKEGAESTNIPLEKSIKKKSGFGQ